MLRDDWLAAGASCVSNMAAPSGGVNCEEFAEFQVTGFSSRGRRDLPFVPGPCSLFWPGRECGPVVAKADISKLLFRDIGGHGGAGLALGSEAAALGSWISQALSNCTQKLQWFLGGKAESGRVGKDCNNHLAIL